MSLVALSCEEDGDKFIVSGFGGAEFSVSRNDIILTQSAENDVAITFSWDGSDLTLNNDSVKVPASLPMAVIEGSASSDFESIIEVNPSSNPFSLTVLALNTLVKNLGLTADISQPVYFRVRSSLGNNIAPKYSAVSTVNVTPYLIDMSKGFILDVEKEDTGFFLYSPNSNGEYSGFVNASSWFNWYMKEGDGTIWGNIADDTQEFVLSDDDENWNFWYPGQGGCYYTTLSTVDKVWTATYISSLTATGDVTGELTFVKPDVYWMLSFTTTVDNATFSVAGNAALYNKATTTSDDAAIAKTIGFMPSANGSLDFSMDGQTMNFTVAETGEYTLKLFLADPTNLNYTITSGGTVEPISEFLYLPGIDDGISGSWTFDNYLRLLNDMDSTFAGVVNVNSQWGYNMGLEADNWTDVYTMGDAEGQLAFQGSENIAAPAPGLYLIKADLKQLTYSHTEVQSLSYSGFNDNWDLINMTPTDVAGVYSGSVALSSVSEWGGKLYLNGEWDDFFGGQDGHLSFLSDGITDDASLPLGTYDLLANLTEQWYAFLGDEIYITGLNDVWDFSTNVLTRTETGVYSGSVTINSLSSGGITIQIDQSWGRFFGGSFDKLLSGGDNITDDQTLANGNYNVTVDLIHQTCVFTLAE